MGDKLIVEEVLKKDFKKADASIEKMDADQIKDFVRSQVDSNGEELFNFLSDHFYRKKNEAVLPILNELCNVHLPYLPEMDLKHYEIIKKAVEFFPENQSYKDALKDFAYLEPQQGLAKEKNWKVSFKNKKQIFDGLYSPADQVFIEAENCKVPLEDFLRMDIEKLEGVIGKNEFESIVAQGKVVKKKVMDYFSYRTANDHYLYFWKSEEIIIVISFTELQPSRYLCKIEFTCHLKN